MAPKTNKSNLKGKNPKTKQPIINVTTINSESSLGSGTLRQTPGDSQNTLNIISEGTVLEMG